MTGAEWTGVAMGGLSLLGGAFVFLSRQAEAEKARRERAEDDTDAARLQTVVTKLDLLAAREAEHHADIVKRMDAADERSSRYASMVQTVPLIEQRVTALEAWRRESGR